MAIELKDTPLYVDSSLIGLWRFEGNNTDEKGLSCTDYNISYSAGKFGQGANFNGASSRIDVTNSANYDVSRLTISAWIKPTSTTQNGFIFEKGSVNTQYSLFLEGTIIIFRTHNGTTTHDLIGGMTAMGIVAGNWHHVVVTYDGQLKKMYVDGILRRTAVYTSTLRTGQSGQRIGAYGGATPAYWFNGSMDDVAVFGRALTNKEVRELYDGTMKKYVKNTLTKYRRDRFVGYVEKGRQIVNTPLFNDPNLVGYWKLDGNSADSKASNNGTDTAMLYPDENSHWGRPAKFNGSTSHIQVANINHQASDFTYSWWVKWNAPVTGIQTYIENGSWGNTLLIRQETYNALNIYAMSTSYGSFNFVPIVGKWHHLALVRSGNTLYLYVDGQLAGTLAFNVTITPATNMWFGASQHSSTQCIQANMVDIAIFSRALTESEVQQICYGFKEKNNLQDYKRLEDNETDPEVEEGELMSPTDIYGCKAWIDFSTLGGLSDGSAISWSADLSGNGNALGQIAVAQNPVYKPNVLNGLATARGTIASSTTFLIPWNYVPASGGTITKSGDYTIHTFTSSGTFVANCDLTVEVMVVGGGGGGGQELGGGGGGGGVVWNSAYAVAAGNHTVTIGNGGGRIYNNGVGSNGGNSVFSGLTAYGGGGGGGATNGANGGCGGGGGSRNNTWYYGGSGSQGYAGGKDNYGTWTGLGSGGGGGAGAVGGDGSANAGGNGGAGFTCPINGVTYAGGGGGGAGDGRTGGTGVNGGGNGRAVSNNPGYDGTANTGGGGGGGGGGAGSWGSSMGGSGIVIVRYRTPQSSIFYIARKTSTGGRVLSGRTNNWLMGYWSNYKQQAYYEGWIDTNSDVANETAFHVWTGITDTTSYLMEDGRIVKYGTGGTTPPFGICIGYLGTSEFSDFDIGEIIAYNRNLNSRERELVSNYLLKKWGMDYNVALMKPVTTSWASTNPWNVTDGSTWTDSWVGVNGTASVTIDLLEVYNVNRVDIFHYWWDGRTYYYNKVETSPDGVTWTTRFDSEVNGRYAETYKGKTITFTTTPVRYVKHTLNGSSANPGSHFSEVRVMGK